jgi:hypothetical protein
MVYVPFDWAYGQSTVGINGPFHCRVGARVETWGALLSHANRWPLRRQRGRITTLHRTPLGKKHFETVLRPHSYNRSLYSEQSRVCQITLSFHVPCSAALKKKQTARPHAQDTTKTASRAANPRAQRRQNKLFGAWSKSG